MFRNPFSGMVEFKLNNLVKVYAVLLLRKRPMHGYELIKSLGSVLLREVSASHVYPFLKLLQSKRMIVLSESGSRYRKQYRLTKAGERFANGLIESFAELIEAGVGRSVRSCAHCRCRVVAGWHQERVGGKVRVFFCRRGGFA